MKVKNGVISIIFTLCIIFSPGMVFPQTVKINWNNNAEADLAGYHVHFGTASGSYQYNLNVGLNKPVYIKGLQNGVPYYFAVSAYDWSFNESDPSEEISLSTYSDAIQDDLINIALQPKEAIYQLGTYDPSSALTLENKLLGIRIDLPEGAAEGPLPVAVGGFCSNEQAYVEIDLAPDGFALKKTATITVQGNFHEKNILVQQYGDGFSSLINNFSISETSLTFPMQSLGKVRIFIVTADPSSAQLGDNEIVPSSSGGNGGGSGGGGGGCFMGISHHSSAGPFGFFLLLSIPLITIFMHSFLPVRRNE